MTAGHEPTGPQTAAVVGDDLFGVAAAVGAGCYPDLAALVRAVDAGERPPATVLACVRAGAGNGDGDPAALARAVTGRVLGLVQGFLAQDVLASSRLVVVTRGAVAAGPGEETDLAGAAVWGLVRSAQSENPDRLVLSDLPAVGGSADDAVALARALGTGEPEVLVRDGGVLARRLARPSGALVPPGGGRPWRLDVTRRGTLDALALVPCPEASAPLAAGQVRIAVRAAGLNFRDVLIALDMYPGAATMGGEVAGIVMETGPGVSGLAAGDRVLGMAGGRGGWTLPGGARWTRWPWWGARRRARRWRPGRCGSRSGRRG